MKILITGSNGQLGRELQKVLKDHELILTDVAEMDITSIQSVEAVFKESSPELVINCAAYTAVDLCETNEDIAFKVNAIGPRNLAIVSNDYAIPIVHISTDYVFDGYGIVENGETRLYKEYDKTAPASFYGKTKELGEVFVQQFNSRHFIVRTAWLYGDGNNFVKTMLSLADKHKQLKVVDDQVGSPTSTYELAKSIERLVGSKEYGIYHGTCEGICSWYGFAVEIFRLSGHEVEVIPCTSDEYPRPAKRPAFSGLDNYMFRVVLGYEYSDWQSALKKYMEELV